MILSEKLQRFRKSSPSIIRAKICALLKNRQKNAKKHTLRENDVLATLKHFIEKQIDRKN